jgi:peptidoglycan/LPS O-acetylase OafA/YrhL
MLKFVAFRAGVVPPSAPESSLRPKRPWVMIVLGLFFLSAAFGIVITGPRGAPIAWGVPLLLGTLGSLLLISGISSKCAK